MSANKDLFDPHFWNEWEGEDFSIIFPADWEVVEPFIPAMKFMALTSDDHDYGATLGVSVANQVAGLSIDEQLGHYKKNMPIMISGLDNVDIEKKDDEHLDYYKATYTGIIDDAQVQYEQYMWFVCDKLITLTFTSIIDPPEEFRMIKEIIFLAFKIK